MPPTLDVETLELGIHDSVATVFPPTELETALSALPCSVRVVDDDSIASCDAIITFDHRDAFIDLDWVHSIQAGIDRFPLETFADRGVVLTNSTGIHGRTVGETVAGYLLSFARRLHDHIADQTDRRWDQPAWDEAFTLPGTEACVVGTGTLGRGIADVVGPLGVDLRGVRRTPDPVPGFDEICATDHLHAAIEDVDFVIAAVPLTDDTHHLFGADEFDAMREDAYFVNVARGPVVGTAALIDVLETDAIAGAALDVFETEPLPPESPLWDFEDVIITPHAAAFTREYYRDIASLVRENVDRLASGEPFSNRVV